VQVIVIGAGVVGSSIAANAAEAGATVIVLERGTPGVGTSSTSYAIVRTASGEQFAADAVISAVGRWTADLATLAGASVPMARFTDPGDITVGYLASTNPLPVSLNRLLTTPWLNVRPDGGGRLLMQALDLDATADPDNVPTIDSDLAKEYLGRLQEVLPGTEGAAIERLVVGQRAMPADGLTIVGPTIEHPWLYVVATHSGVTLAPLLGRSVAQEVLGGHEPLFDEFRPDRFATGVPGAPPRGPRKPGEQ
jgi:glycine/D-amino acid oxidase-like deaminating enzyme